MVVLSTKLFSDATAQHANKRVHSLLNYYCSHEDAMTHAVKLPVAVPVALECEFWVDSDGWNGVCQEFSITVHSSSFEDAKREMEAALKAHIEGILRQGTRERVA
jgi:predicted RNase H-like HicB family nuclease